MPAITMGPRNRVLVFGTEDYFWGGYLQYGIFTYDPSTRQYSTIVYNPVEFEETQSITMNQDGDYFVVASTLAMHPDRVYRVTPSGQYSTVLWSGNLGWLNGGFSTLAKDIDTGHLLVPFMGASQLPNSIIGLPEHSPTYMYHGSRRGPRVYLNHDQEIATRDHFLNEGSNEVYRYSLGTTRATLLTTLPLLGLEYAQGHVIENQSTPDPQIIAYALRRNPTRASLLFLDPARNMTITRTVTFINSPGQARAPYPYTQLHHYGNRYIQTERTGNRRFLVNLNFPTFPSRRYVLALGLSGVRPGLTLADGRHIWLNPDALTFLSIANLIPAVFSPGSQQLDTRGSAMGVLDLTAVPGPLHTALHMVAAVLDPAAPEGIAFITEPYPFQL